MKATFKYSAIALMLMASASSVVMAADSAELKVIGRIGSPTCNVAVGTGSIDYGQMAVGSLNSDVNADTVLPLKTLPGGVTITCDADTSITMSIKDNRFSSAGGNTGIISNTTYSTQINAGKGAGLGLDSAGNKVGGYMAFVVGTKVDGVSTRPLPLTFGKGVQISSSVTQIVADAGDVELGFQPITGADVAVGKVFTFDYAVQAQIAPRSKLDLSKPIALDGSMAVQVNYL